MIQVLYTHFDSKLPDGAWNSYLRKVPYRIQERINRYLRWQDRHAGLFGKLLLLEGLRQYGYASDCLENLSYNEFGRPFLSHKADFSISHSAEYVVCAMTDQGRLGIDIEKIRPIELSNFEGCMTSDEQRDIRETGGYEKFYEYWTKKECAAKAEGKGLSIPMINIHLDKKIASVYERIWYLEEIFFRGDYKCHLATDVKVFALRIKEIKLS